MTTNHIGQLAQWYADAEQITKTNLPNKGDTLITPYEAGGFGIEVEEDGWTPDIVMPGEPVRILARAPKPKPAWHDAVAVIAHRYGDYGLTPREVYVRRDGDRWESPSYYARTSALVDPAPLIEAKVTDEMVDRVLDVLHAWNDTYPAGLGTKLAAAALGLETT